MRRAVIDCLRTPGGAAALQLDPIRFAEDEVIEGFLISEADREVWPLIAGVAVLPADLRTHLRLQGSVYWRSPAHDPRMVRFIRGQAGQGFDRVHFDDVVGHYRDLVIDPPEGYATDPHPDDVALDRLLLRLGLPAEARGLVMECGVGRGVFVLGSHVATALGSDASLAHVRRARNISVTVEHFFLPGIKGTDIKQIPVDLGSLVREGTDFLVAEPDALPLMDDAFHVVVRDFERHEVMTGEEEALRVLRPGGWLIGRGSNATEEREGVWRARRCP